MLRELSVYENLSMYARLRLPPETSADVQHELVLDVIGCLGLSHISHELIGDEEKRGISGGQHKRVNVGMELVSRPSLLFLDEPTSGLDSTTSFELLEGLGVIAKGGAGVARSPPAELPTVRPAVDARGFVNNSPRYCMFDDVLLSDAEGAPSTSASRPMRYVFQSGFEMLLCETPRLLHECHRNEGGAD